MTTGDCGSCRGNSTACDGTDLRPVCFGVAEPFLMCSGCRGSAFGREATVVERRVMRQPVARERRWVAPWRRHARGKILSEAVA